MQKHTILVTGADLAEEAIKLLSEFELIYAGKAPQTDELIALAKKHNPIAIIVRYGKINFEIMDAAPQLRVISKHGSGTDTIDKVAASERSIAVKAAIGANASAVAEHALSLMLASAKSTIYLNERTHNGHWDKAVFKTNELNAKTIGIIGLGAIGQKFAKMCNGLEMQILGFDPYTSSFAEYIQRATLDDIWEKADVISFHCPLTDDNRNLFNSKTISACKPGVIIINTARGGLINEPDLLNALNNGQVGMAALDSFTIEPMTTPHIFQGHPKIILSPHIGGVTKNAYINMGVGAAKNILEVLNSSKN